MVCVKNIKNEAQNSDILPRKNRNEAKDNDEALLRVIMDIGAEILRSGGEVTRVEDSISRMLTAYGWDRINVYTITSIIEVSAVTAEGNTVSQIRRLYDYDTNLERVAMLNQLSRNICSGKPQVEEIEKCMREIMHLPGVNIWIGYIGAILAACGFTIFFGGTYEDIGATAILACFIHFIERKGLYKKNNQLLFYLVCSFITGAVGCICVHIGIGIHLDKILSGCIMLIIPGIAITYSVRDMLLGEIITGFLKFIESLLIAVTIAGGYVLSIFIMGEIL